MLEALENIIVRKLLDEEISYKPSEKNDKNHDISIYVYHGVCDDDHITITCRNDEIANQVENKLIEWKWKYHKTYDTHYRRNTYTYFKVLKEIPDKIKITDTMFLYHGNVIITNNIKQILSKKLDETKFKHIDYDAPPYALCGSSWTIQYEDTIIVLEHSLSSGGHVSWGEQDIIETGEWGLMLPDFLEPYKEQLTKLANENIPQGCCGGCI